MYRSLGVICTDCRVRYVQIVGCDVYGLEFEMLGFPFCDDIKMPGLPVGAIPVLSGCDVVD